MKNLFLLFIFFLSPLAADPWGKDADIVNPTPSCPPSKRTNVIAECLIGFHQNVVSPADGPRSHYTPSSSQYTLDAMRMYGFLYGFILGCDRLMRENNDPWIYPTVPWEYCYTKKWDPVPCL